MGENNLKKILVIDNSQKVSGALRSIVNFSNELRAEFRFYFAVPKGYWFELQDISKEQLYLFDFIEIRKSISILWYLPQLIFNTIKLIRIIRIQNIGVVHVNDLYNMIGVCVKFFAKDTKIIYHVRLRKSSYVGVLYHVWLNLIGYYADEIVCVSTAVLNDIGTRHKCNTIYDALPSSWIQKEPRTSTAEAKVNFLYIGNYIPGKGQDFALDALIEVLKQTKEVRLTFIGDIFENGKSRNWYNRLSAKVKSLSLEQYVEIRGRSIQIDKDILRSDIVLNFSESESFSMVCLEALACGKPVISSKSGGPEEIIRHNINGILVTNQDVNSMSIAMLKLATDKKLRLEFSQNSLVDFEKKFNLNELAKKLRTLYLK